MMDSWIPWLPLLVTLITIVSGAAIYGFQKRIDRRLQIQSERRRLYRDFVVCAQKARMKIWHSEALDFFNWYTEYKTVHGELMVTAPDNVIAALSKFDLATGRVVNLDKLEQRKEFGREFDQMSKWYFELIFQMRKDTFGKTIFDVGQHSQPFAQLNGVEKNAEK